MCHPAEYASYVQKKHKLDGFGKLRQLSGWKTVTPARGFVYCDFTSSMSVLALMREPE